MKKNQFYKQKFIIVLIITILVSNVDSIKGGGVNVNNLLTSAVNNYAALSSKISGLNTNIAGVNTQSQTTAGKLTTLNNGVDDASDSLETINDDLDTLTSTGLGLSKGKIKSNAFSCEPGDIFDVGAYQYYVLRKDSTKMRVMCLHSIVISDTGLTASCVSINTYRILVQYGFNVAIPEANYGSENCSIPTLKDLNNKTENLPNSFRSAIQSNLQSGLNGEHYYNSQWNTDYGWPSAILIGGINCSDDDDVMNNPYNSQNYSTGAYRFNPNAIGRYYTNYGGMTSIYYGLAIFPAYTIYLE